MGLVIPKSLTFSQRWGVVRDFILRNLKLIELADTSKAFPGVLLEQVILLCQKSNEKTKSFRGIHFFLEEEPVSMHARKNFSIVADVNQSVKLRVRKAHKASFDYSVVFRKGDKVKVVREDPEMPGWYWCEDKDGVSSWIPEEYLDRDGAKGRVTHDYDTPELTVKVGDTLEYVTDVKFWTLCRAPDDREGWVPTTKLTRVRS